MTERDSLAEALEDVIEGGDDSRNYDDMASALLVRGYRKPRVITTPDELDKLRYGSIVAMISHHRNVPMVIVFQKGSLEHGGGWWCTPEAIGQIPPEAVFEYIQLNGYPAELTVLHEVKL